MLSIPRGARKPKRSLGVAVPGIIPHQHGSSQSLLVAIRVSQYTSSSLGESVGKGVLVIGISVGVGYAVGLGTWVGLAEGVAVVKATGGVDSVTIGDTVNLDVPKLFVGLLVIGAHAVINIITPPSKIETILRCRLSHIVTLYILLAHGSLIFWTKSQIEKSAILPRKQGFCEHAA